VTDCSQTNCPLSRIEVKPTTLPVLLTLCFDSWHWFFDPLQAIQGGPKCDCLVHFVRAVCWPYKVRLHATTTLLLVTLSNIHRFKKNFIRTLSNKPFLIWLLTSPPHLKYVATLPCNLLLITCFADINVSQDSVATYARCGGMFNIHLTANLLGNLLVKKFYKSVKIWQNYGHESVAPFLAHPVVMTRTYAKTRSKVCWFNFIGIQTKEQTVPTDFI